MARRDVRGVLTLSVNLQACLQQSASAAWRTSWHQLHRRHRPALPRRRRSSPQQRQSASQQASRHPLPRQSEVHQPPRARRRRRRQRRRRVHQRSRWPAAGSGGPGTCRRLLARRRPRRLDRREAAPVRRPLRWRPQCRRTSVACATGRHLCSCSHL